MSIDSVTFFRTPVKRIDPSSASETPCAPSSVLVRVKKVRVGIASCSDMSVRSLL